MRTFELVRFNSRYHDSSIVCDRCGLNLNPNFYYCIYEDGHSMNEYPFHTRRCAREFIRLEYTDDHRFNEIYIADGNKDFLQEEATEE